MILCCDGWETTGYASCIVVDSASCPSSSMWPKSIALSFEPDDGGAVACASPAVACVATAWDSCCDQDCTDGVQCADLSLRPSCCWGYCSQTPVVMVGDSGLFTGGQPTERCNAVGPQTVVSCCDKTSITIPESMLPQSGEWTVGFDNPTSLDASVEPSPASAPSPVLQVVNSVDAGGAPPAAFAPGGCSTSGGSETEWAWAALATLCIRALVGRKEGT